MADIENVRQALQQVMDPELNRSIVDLGMVHDLALNDGVVTFTLALTTIKCPLQQSMRDDAQEKLMALDVVEDVRIKTREMTDEEKKAIMGEPQENQGSAAGVNHIKHVVAVLSGKGGVGKSSVAALLAVALRRAGHTVGVLDADITGPSIPKLLLPESPRPMGSPLGIMPVTTESGIKVMSINLLLADPNQAVIWRGPLISGAIKQFWGDVVWGTMDYLIVDLPPGTSDASLTVMQSMPVNGIVLVTTPQSLAAMVVRKSANLAAQLDIPIIGVIENMSYVQCPDCDRVIELFGPSRGPALAQEVGAPLLGRLPVDPEIAKLGDLGQLETYDGEDFARIAERLMPLIPEEAKQPQL